MLRPGVEETVVDEGGVLATLGVTPGPLDAGGIGVTGMGVGAVEWPDVTAVLVAAG